MTATGLGCHFHSTRWPPPGWVALGGGFWVAGLGFGRRVAVGLASMGCTMHQSGWPPYVGVPHPCWVRWHRTRMSMAPPGHLCYGCFLFFPMLGLHPLRVTATQSHIDLPRCPGLWAFARVCSTHNPSTVGWQNNCDFGRRSFVCGHVSIDFLGLDDNGRWRPTTSRQAQSP